MKNIGLAALLLLSMVGLLPAGCIKIEPGVEDNYRLRHRGADMPVWVRGNLTQRKIVLFLHGGPGECALCLRPYLERVEEQVAVAYWDQRIAGSASGNADPKTLNYEQFAEDLEMVVRLLRLHYPDVKIYLLGHSFGVEMAWQFLTTGDNQSLVNGFVAVDGTYSTYDWLVRVREWVIREAQAQGDTEAEQYMTNLSLTRENMRTVVDWGAWYMRMFRLGANPVWPSDDSGYVWNLWFKSPHTKLSQSTNTRQYDDYYAREVFRFDRRAQLSSVRIPVALFWGAKDGIIPLEVAYDTRERLTVSAPMVVFENSWHAPFHTETARFAEELLAFVRAN